jgi:hypothetical protein
MPTVRISTNWQHPATLEWIGAPAIDSHGRIARSFPIPEAAYEGIESAIAKGNTEGIVYLADGTRFQWFLDR